MKCKSPNKPILDPYADRLFNAIQVMNLGNNRTRWHDTCQRAVLDTARNAGLRVEEGLVIQLCTEGLGGDASKAWDKLVVNGRTLHIVRGGLPRRFSLEGGTLL